MIQLSISDTKNIDTMRRKINRMVGVAGYGDLPDPEEAVDGALFVSGGTLYQNQLVADVPTWVAI